MNLDLIFPASVTLSGHKSITQKTIGIFFIYFKTIAGIPTVIGEGSWTKIISKPFFDKKVTLMDANKAKEI